MAMAEKSLDFVDLQSFEKHSHASDILACHFFCI